LESAMREDMADYRQYERVFEIWPKIIHRVFAVEVNLWEARERIERN
jgi:hypothetical protein